MSELSGQELGLAKAIGFSIYQDMIPLAIESVTWGAYFILWMFAMYIQLRAPRTFTQVFMLSITILLFTSSTILWALNITWNLVRAKITLVDNWETTMNDRILMAYETLTPLGAPMEGLFMLNMLVGDVIIITRAKAIWGGSWKIVALPIIFLITALAFSILSVICVASTERKTTTSHITGSYACRRAEPIAWALSLITNVLATSAIAYRAWLHRKVIKETFGSNRCLSGVERILTLVVESGFVYILILLTQMINFWEGLERGNGASYAWAILSPLGDQITGIYATSVIVLVSLQKTYWVGTNIQIEVHGDCSYQGRTLTQIEFFPNNACDNAPTEQTPSIEEKVGKDQPSRAEV